MKAIKNVCAEGASTYLRKIICIIVILSALTFMSSCTAEELPINQEAEIITPIDGVEADGDVEGDPVIIIFNPTTTPPKK